MNGRNGPTTFLSLNNKIGGQVNNNRPSVGQILIREQTRYIYKKTESGEIINTETIQQELEQERQLDRTDNTNGETNPYKELIENNAEKLGPLMTQMEQWSILSNVLNYIQYDKHPKNYHNLSINAVNKYKNSLDTSEERDIVELDLGVMPKILQGKYLDIYEGVQSEVVNTTRFDENLDLSTMYIGRSDRPKSDKLKAEEYFPISEQGYTLDKLLDGIECQLLLGTGASKLFMSKSYYMQCTSLHSLPRFASKTQRIQVGNGQYVSLLFIIPVIIDVHGHRFEIYTLVSEIHENVDLVLGIKNVFKLEGVINSGDCCFIFLNRSPLIFPMDCIMLKPKEQKLIKVKALFIDEISGLGKILDGGTHSTLLIKLKFTHNVAVLDIVNNGTETMIFKPEEMLGIVYLRLLGYYKIKQGILQQILSKYYRFEREENLCEYFNNF